MKKVNFHKFSSSIIASCYYDDDYTDEREIKMRMKVIRRLRRIVDMKIELEEVSQPVLHGMENFPKIDLLMFYGKVIYFQLNC